MKRERLHRTISGLYAVTPDTPETSILLERVEAALKGGARVVAGADALAVISALFAVPDIGAAARRFTALFE